MMKAFEKSWICLFFLYNIFYYTSMPREPIPRSPQIRYRLAKIKMFTNLIKDSNKVVDNFYLTVRKIANVPRHNSRWIFLCHALDSKVVGIYQHIAFAHITLKKIIKLFVWTAWIVLTRYKMEIVASHIICLMKKS